MIVNLAFLYVDKEKVKMNPTISIYYGLKLYNKGFLYYIILIQTSMFF